MGIIGNKNESVYSYDEYCNNCAEQRKVDGLSPHIKLRLRETTTRKNLPVAICPECDGPALDFALKNNG